MIRGIDEETEAVFVGDDDDVDVPVDSPVDDDNNDAEEEASEVCVVDTSAGMIATGGGDSVGEIVDVVRVAAEAAAAAAAFLALLLDMIEGMSMARRTPTQKRIWHMLKMNFEKAVLFAMVATNYNTLFSCFFCS